VADGIIGLARSRLPLHHPASLDGPPPRDKLGEDINDTKSSHSSLGEVAARSADGGAK
jgi:hypothetical protein